MRPSIRLTSLAEIASPNPVPPKRRLVEESDWLNDSKMCCCFSCGMPMPVSETEQ